MYNISKLISLLESDFKKNNITENLEKIVESLILVLGSTNDLLLLENWEIKLSFKCATWKGWFWNVPWTKATPLWLHKIIWYYGDKLPWNAILKWRVDTWRRLEYFPSYPNIYPAIISRILQLKWLEKRNSNTETRYIYIHWTPNTWYWDKKEFKQSYWCIWLKPDDMITLFEHVKRKETFVYIMK